LQFFTGLEMCAYEHIGAAAMTSSGSVDYAATQSFDK